MSNYNNQGGQGRQHKDKECYAEFTGVVRPMTMKEGDPVRFFQFKNGGGAIHFLLEVQKKLPADASGQERVKTERYKIDAYTNKDLTPEFLQSLVPGTKVNVASEPTYNYPKDANGQPGKPELVFRAFAIRVREYPQQQPVQYQQAPQPQYPAYLPQYPAYQPQQGYAPAQYPNQAYGQPGGQYVPQGGFGQPQAQPQQQRPQQYPQQAPQQPKYGGQPVPPYFQPPQQGAPMVDMPAFDDLPEA